MRDGNRGKVIRIGNVTVREKEAPPVSSQREREMAEKEREMLERERDGGTEGG